jgi:rhamnosyltransferase
LLKAYEKFKEVAVYAGLLIDENTKRVLYEVKELTNKPIPVKLISFSGMLVHRRIIEKIGLPSKRLFMDVADWEYCLRINYFGFRIILVPKAKIYHSVGTPYLITLPFRKTMWKYKNGKFIKTRGRRIVIATHLPMRYYTWAKNSIKLTRSKFITPDFRCWLRNCFFNELMKIIFYENQKSKKFLKFIHGIIDGYLGK